MSDEEHVANARQALPGATIWKESIWTGIADPIHRWTVQTGEHGLIETHGDSLEKAVARAKAALSPREADPVAEAIAAPVMTAAGFREMMLETADRR